MMLAAVCIKNFRSHARRCGLLKLNSLLYWDPACLKNIISTSAFPMYYPLHTVPHLQDSVPCESKPIPESVVPLSSCVIVHEACLCEENKKSDSSLVNYVMVMESRELWKPDICSDDLILRNEFKSVLSRSCFHYDVNMVSHQAIEHLLTSAAQGSLILTGGFHYSFDCGNSNSSLILNSDSSSSQEGLDKQANNKMRTGLPSEEQLLNIISRLCHSLLHFFKESHDLTMYHKSIVFQNNLRGITTRGISPYAQQMYLMRIYGRIHYAQVRVDIMKITHHVEDGTVRIRWRVSGATRRRVLSLLWKYKDSTWKKIVEEEPEWLDGFSVFNVGQDGLIYKHVCDKMMPDEEQLHAKHNSLRSRLLKLLGLPHQPATVSGLSAMLAISPLGQNDGIVSSPSKTR